MINILLKILARLFLFLLSLFILVLAYSYYRISEQDTEGREWCENIINKFTHDPDQSLESYPQQAAVDGYLLMPHEKIRDLKLRFTVDQNKYFKCSYYTPGVLFPILDEYSSETGKWRTYD